MNLQSLGLIVNPLAGSGRQRNLQFAAEVLSALGPGRVVAGPGDFGADAFPAAKIITPGSMTGRAATQSLTVSMAQAEIDALIVVGGDGTLADAAVALFRAGLTCPILGIGAGSINAGRLVTCTGQHISFLNGAQLWVEPVTALTASESGELLSLAFNDIVISTTVVGTVEGNIIDLDAHAFLDGKKTPGQPVPVGSYSARVMKKGQYGQRVVAQGARVGTVIAGFSESEAFYGKAIAGSVLLASLCDAPAGCLVCEQPLVRTQLTRAELAGVEPVHTAFVSLFPQETIEVDGLASPAILCADGNPLLRLEPEHMVQIGLAVNAVQVVRLGNRTGQTG